MLFDECKRKDKYIKENYCDIKIELTIKVNISDYFVF